MYAVCYANDWRNPRAYRAMYGTLTDAARACRALEKRDGRRRWIICSDGQHLESWEAVLRLAPGY